jgi:hypothetical protein
VGPLKRAMVAAVRVGGEWTSQQLATEISRPRKFTNKYCDQLVEAGYLVSVRRERGAAGGRLRHVYVWTGKVLEDKLAEVESTEGLTDGELDELARNDGSWWPEADRAVHGAMFRMVVVGRTMEKQA